MAHGELLQRAWLFPCLWRCCLHLRGEGAGMGQMPEVWREDGEDWASAFATTKAVPPFPLLSSTAAWRKAGKPPGG